ncbi:MAG: 4-(cytidine 5'-diphospho)-2-C-methyl-D-erythritol kinase [Lachnospiraceae bacterium]|nr:4-(cytidine 5'-diphospho)-2-C-methyl-D-erythritol kinase [Lachnospiraceae bacterium]
MDRITQKAYAKINLSLDVTGIREDGYHLVQMVMQSLSLHDELTMEKIPEDRIILTTNVEGLPCDERNLVYKAVSLIRETYGIRDGVRMHLQKTIPMEAGLAGGSSDCAAALKGASALFGLELSLKRLMELGVTLGADVPYCLLGGSALAEGIGEVLTPLRDMPDCTILLAKPAASVSTGGVYKALDALSGYAHPDTAGILAALEQGDLQGIAERLCNVLELVTIPRHPEIERIKEQMIKAGAMGSLMSGSGSTVFGIFADEKKAAAAGEQLRAGGFSGQIFCSALQSRQSTDTI